MFNKSRTDIYDFLYNLFYDVVTKNVYLMNEPQELTKSDAETGFIVLHVGGLIDESEFTCEAYGSVRCYVEAFVPPMTRGRLDYEKFHDFESMIDNVIDQASQDNSGPYTIISDVILSSDAEEVTNSNNIYFTFIKSFILNINEQ